MLVDFHWIRPWFLALLPLVWLFSYAIYHYQNQPSGWRGLIAKHLQPRLLSGSEQRTSLYSRSILPLILTVAVLALAGPAVYKHPQPAYTLKKATVLIMDMSLSMRATDLKPNRLAQARFKALDFAKSLKEGELALVTFAGDAFVISPLTPDHNNISLLIPDLKPEIMPVQGSDLASALTLADKLLQQAGYQKGDVVLFTDGFASRNYTDLRNLLDSYPHRLSILAFGTSEGAPVQLESGELLKDSRGAIVVPKVPLLQLKQLAELRKGVFVKHNVDNSDIEKLLSLPQLQMTEDATKSNTLSGDQWQDAGVFLVWLILPLVLLAYRNSLLPLAICWLFLPMPSKAAQWQDLYLSPQQQAQKAYEQGDFNKAQAKFTDPLWQGNAAYRDGRFADAEAFYRNTTTAEGKFNLGNSLAQQQKFDEAIAAYQGALRLNPDLAGAKENLKKVEQLKQQQAQQEQSSSQSKDGQQSDDNNQGDQQSGESKTDKNQSGDKQSGDKQSGDKQSEQNNKADGEQSPSQDQQGDNRPANGSEQQTTEQESSETQSAEEKHRKALESTKTKQGAGEQSKPAQQKAINEAWPQATPEQSQQLESLMRKVQDDPSILLRNKMYLEYQKRQHQGLPQGVNEEW